MRAAAVVVAGAALAAGACSGGNDGEEAFRTRANAICADFAGRIDAVPTPQTLAELAGSAGRIEELLEEGATGLRALEPPESQAQAWSDWLALNDAAAESAGAIADAAAAEDRERIVELATRAEEDEAAADALAGKLGLDDCVVADEEGSSDR